MPRREHFSTSGGQHFGYCMTPLGENHEDTSSRASSCNEAALPNGGRRQNLLTEAEVLTSVELK
jgi:hypothetical protein